MPAIQPDSLLSFAYRNRDEVLLNEKRTTLAGLRLDLLKLQNKPVINFMASAGGKNGYVPELAKIKPNYVVGLGLSIPIFDGNKNKYNMSQAQSALTTLSYESDITKRSISNDIQEAEAYMFAARKKISQLSFRCNKH